MRKYIFIMALAALASCSDSEFVGDETLLREADENGSKAIVFGTGIHNVTRAAFTGADAAEMLNKEFVFMGTKTIPNNPPTTSNVFDHYTAHWTENTANTTLTNSNNWEYVGYDPYYGDDNNPNSPISKLPAGAKQTIKYWDYSASKYDFAAYSLGKGVTLNGNTTYAIPTAFDFSNLEDGVTPVYTLTGSADELKACYISDLVTLSNNEDGNEFGQVVNFTFRPLIAKVRLAFYETIPGYAVKNVYFYDAINGTKNPVEKATLLTADGQATFPSGAGTMSVSFPNNKAYVTFTKKSDNDNNVTNSLEFGKLSNYPTEYEGVLNSGNYLGRTSNTATYADGYASENTPNPEGTYFSVLPNEDANNLMIRIKYTLVSTDTSGETIIVDNATAVIPKELAKWGPNYAYTYIFKISDMTNGTTGVDQTTGAPVMGLTPITLNAVVVDNEDGTQETITTVSEPSITTYMAGKVVTDYDEYITGKTIYVIVNSGTNNVALATNETPSTPKYRLFTATVEEGALQGITEASVDNAFRFGVANDEHTVYTLTDADHKNLVLTDVSNKITLTDKIAAADSPTGKDITVGEKMVATFSPAANKVYAFQYIVEEKTATYNPVVPLGEKLTAGTKYYTSNTGTGEFTAIGNERIDGKYYEITYNDAVGTTLKAGETYYTESGGEYSPYQAQGDEPILGVRTYYKKIDAVYELFTAADGTTLTKGATYYTSQSNESAFVAQGNEVISEGTYYIKDGDNYTLLTAADGTTLTAGVTYYTEADGVYTEHTAVGNEVIAEHYYYKKTSDERYEALTTADGTTLTKDATYYTSNTGGTEYIATGAEPISGYYTRDYTLVTGKDKLDQGTTYYVSTTDVTGFTATGNELVTGEYYEKVTENSVEHYYPVNKLWPDHIYYTSAKGAGRFTAQGTENITADTYWTWDPQSGSEGKYYYKVIKVQE